MSLQTVEAIYEDGTFRILSPRKVGLINGQTVRLKVEMEDEIAPLLQRALHIFDGLSDEDVAEVERIALARQPFFSERAISE